MQLKWHVQFFASTLFQPLSLMQMSYRKEAAVKYKSIITHKKEDIGFLTLNRPEVKNRLTADMCTEISDALKEFEKDNDVKAVIINATGNNFSVGKESGETKGQTTLERLEMSQPCVTVQDNLSDFTKKGQLLLFRVSA